VGLAVETIGAGDFAAQLAQLVLARGDSLIDPAPAVGCVCSGAIHGAVPAESRASIIALEPPRSPTPIVEESAALPLALPLPAFARDPADLVAERTAPRDEQRSLTGPVHALGDAPPPPPVAPTRRPRLTPPGLPAITAAAASAPPPSPQPAPRRRPGTSAPRMVPGAVPVSSDSEGRILPRAYVARRKSPRSGIPIVPDMPENRPSTLGPIPAEGHHAPERAPRHTVPADRDLDTGHPAADSERPVARSVEPSGVAAIPAGEPREAADAPADAPANASAPASPPAAASPRAGDFPPPLRGATGPFAALGGALLARGVGRLRERSALMLVTAIAATGLLLGVAIGYSMARHRASIAAGAPDDRSADSVLANPERGFSGVRESVSAGGIAPSPSQPRRGPVKAPARGGVAGGHHLRAHAEPAGAAQSTAPLPAISQPSPVGGVAAAPAMAATPAPAVARGSADSLARAESLAAERESIRREIALRRARLDSIERARLRLDSVQRVEQSGGRPPDD